MVRTRVGYAGGGILHPTYRAIGDHSEAIQLDYDPQVLSFEDLLKTYWEEHLPSRPALSRQYASVLFYHSDEQRQACRHSLRERQQRRGPLYTDVLPVDTGGDSQRFWLAEDYHQKYYLKSTHEVLKDFKAIYPHGADLTASTAAARVNGLLGGYLGAFAQPADRERLLDGLGLSPRGRTHLERLLDRRMGRRL